MSSHRSCPLCGRDNREEPASPHSRDEWQIKTCRACRFVYLENAPVYAELEETAAWERTKPVEKARRRKEEPVLHALAMPVKAFRKKIMQRDKLTALINRYFPAGRILDIGCSSGRKLARLDKRFILHGIEISKQLAAEANALFSQRGGGAVHGTALQGLETFEPDYFGGIIMRAFLEHESNPAPVLRASCRVMKPGGYLIVKVPNYDSLNRRLRQSRWCGFRFPDHVNYFTPSSLRRLLNESGFALVQFNILDRLPTSDNMWAVATKEK